MCVYFCVYFYVLWKFIIYTWYKWHEGKLSCPLHRWIPVVSRREYSHGTFYEQELDIYASLKVKWSESRSVVSNSLRPHGLCSPWISPGQNTGVGTLSLLQGIFPTQESNRGLLHCRRILYQLSPGEYNLSLVINKNHFYFLSPISISLHFISLVNVVRGDKKMNLSNPQSEGKQSGSQGVPAGAPAGSAPHPFWMSQGFHSSLVSSRKHT